MIVAPELTVNLPNQMDNAPTTLSEYQDKTLELCELLSGKWLTRHETERIARELRELADDVNDLAKGVNLAVRYAEYNTFNDPSLRSDFGDFIGPNAPTWLKLS